MHKLASGLIGLDIFSVHIGRKIGKVSGMINNKKDLRIELLLISMVETGPLRYLSIVDVRSISGDNIIIDSEDKLSFTEDLLRQKDIIEDDFRLIGAKVVSNSGDKMGRVKDYSIDYQNFRTRKIHVSTRLLNKLLHERLVIDQQDVIDVHKNTIIISDSRVKLKNYVAKLLPSN